jgi:lysophospholipase L1-like esterase
MSLSSVPLIMQASTPRKRRPPRKRGKLMLVLFLGLVVLPFASLEGFLRVARKSTTQDLMALTGRIAGASDMKPWAQVDAFSAYRGHAGSAGLGKTINSHGFMSTPELSVAKPEGTLRILFLGGSSTAGTGVDLADDETWPWQVVENLKAAFPERTIDFINGALGGYTTFESYGRLWSRLRVYEPDVIVMYHAWNEMYYFDKAAPERLVEWRTLEDGDWTLDRKRSSTKRFEPWWVDGLLQYSQLAIRMRMRLAAMSTDLNGEVGADKGLDSDFDAGGLDIYRFNLKLIREASEMMGAVLFVAKQATLIVPGLSEDDRDRCAYNYHGFDHDAHVRAFDAIYSIIDEELPAERVIDVTRLSGQSAVFEDQVHPTVAGARRISAVVSEPLQAYLESLE